VIEQIAAGRTDLVFDFVHAGNSVAFRDQEGVSLLQWCAYYGDVSAMRFLLLHGESREILGENLD